uniref:VWFA domain-containing protein n=1 Tax=Parastrongyloides trichosuri TaxID=131310 RepID=A0A0N4ZPL9_PARTI
MKIILFLLTLLPLTFGYVKDRHLFGCREYNSVFLIDSSLDGSKVLFDQINIIDLFYENGNKKTENIFLMITDQGANTVVNNYSFVGPNDQNSLNMQVNSALHNPVASGDISYFELINELNKTEILLSPDLMNANVVIFISSHINDIATTAPLLKYIENNAAIVMAVIYDEKYRSDAVSLVGSNDNVYTFNLQSDTDYSKVTSWIRNTICIPPSMATTKGLMRV